MATNPTVMPGTDAIQALLAAQKQSQDLIKNSLETFRLQQEVDDRNAQNKWNNSWDVLEKMAEKTPGGLTTVIGQNQELIQQLFRSNGMNRHQADLAVSNLRNTLLLPEDQMKLRLSKYMMNPYAIVTEVVSRAAEQPDQRIGATPVVKKGEATPSPAPGPAPAPAAKETGTVTAPTYKQDLFDAYYQTQKSIQDQMSQGRPTNMYTELSDPNTNKAKARQIDFSKRMAEIPALKEFIDAHPGEESDAVRAAEAYLNVTMDDEQITTMYGKLSEKERKELNEYATSVWESYRGTPLGQDVIKRFAVSGESTKISQNTRSPIMSRAEAEKTNAEKAQLAASQIDPFPGESLEAYAMRRSPIAQNPRETWKKGVGKGNENETDEEYAARIEMELRKPGRNDETVRYYDKMKGAANAQKADPTLSTDQATAGALMVSQNTVNLAANHSDTPQGQRALDLIASEGAKVQMTFEEVAANRANNTPIDGKTKADYWNYMDNMSKSSADWLSGYAPLTDEYIRQITGRFDVAEGYQDILAVGTGGGAALQNRKMVEVQMKELRNTMERFAATLDLDKEKFGWEKVTDLMKIQMQKEEMALRSGSSTGGMSDILKRQLAIIDRVQKGNTGKDARERWNYIVDAYTNNVGGDFKAAWDIYTEWMATSQGIPIDQIQQEGMKRGVIGSLIFGAYDMSKSAPVPPSYSPGQTDTGTGGVTDEADSVSKSMGF